MKLEGSCHCRSVRFTLQTHHPSPFMRCYCSVCRKTAGGGGYAINLSGDAETMKVRGEKHVTVYRARIRNPEDSKARLSPGRRHFCARCGSALWQWDPRWPELIHPFASAIDTPLPKPPETVHIMLEFKPDWVRVEARKGDKKFRRYPRESIAEWHERTGQTVR